MPKDVFLNLLLEKQEKVMCSSISEFLKHGFTKGNVGKFAKSAGVAKGSMYQYFENKREIFLYSVQWSIGLLVKKYEKYMIIKDTEVDIFQFFYQNSKDMWLQMREERGQSNFYDRSIKIKIRIMKTGVSYLRTPVFYTIP